MEIDIFDAVNELKSFYEENAPLSKISGLITYKKVSISLEYKEGVIKIKAQHPLSIKIYKIYNILLRLFLVKAVKLTIDFVENNQQKSVSKQFGSDENIDPVIEDLKGLPHDSITDIVIDTDYFKIVETQDMSDNVSIMLKKNGKKELFKSLSNYLFPFVNMPANESLLEEINFSKQEDQLTVDILMKIDGSPMGIKSKKVRLV
ncbi:MAG: hypothetical protein OH338_01590 [Candidatus Parvarchaeota archaeon]|nr:hypothetical protein [Candidatus Parvarchaeota archaeon]MCW1295156.1 hypothetical protein [Candidatus Parvarchaeum tengchongense]MCW1299025.1 hypothetical protein [Candidatus Parvarchaeum tengchongense]MCW1312107.1 hypothetical protein [Candidatus Parvarchaeum tengchongense]